MAAELEKRWEWEEVEPGIPGDALMLEITSDSVTRYASGVRNSNPDYLDALKGDLAMPTNILHDAPLRRNSVADASGFTALEWVKENARQTPFSKCTVRWFAPIRVGDTITSSARVVEKYERRGNKFVTFRVEAKNQDQLKVAEYDYTCIFEYAEGRNED